MSRLIRIYAVCQSLLSSPIAVKELIWAATSEHMASNGHKIRALSDLPALAQSIIRPLFSINTFCILLLDTECPDQTASIRSLIPASVVRIYLKKCISLFFGQVKNLVSTINW